MPLNGVFTQHASCILVFWFLVISHPPFTQSHVSLETWLNSLEYHILWVHQSPGMNNTQQDPFLCKQILIRSLLIQNQEKQQGKYWWWCISTGANELSDLVDSVHAEILANVKVQARAAERHLGTRKPPHRQPPAWHLWCFIFDRRDVWCVWCVSSCLHSLQIDSNLCFPLSSLVLLSWFKHCTRRVHCNLGHLSAWRVGCASWACKYSEFTRIDCSWVLVLDILLARLPGPIWSIWIFGANDKPRSSC